jgi:hypothetical protein
VFQAEVFILELASIDGLSTSSIASSEVATLAHEVVDHTVEGGSLVAKTFLSGAQSTEVFGGLWDNIAL